MTRAQKRAYREHWSRWGIDLAYDSILEASRIFGRSAPLVLEIGFGRGEALLGMAALRPERDFIGVEVHRPGIAATLQALSSAPLSNVRLLRADALQLLEAHLPPRVLSELCVFFPDPWPRPGDAHRRLLRPRLIELLALRMHAGGIFRVATDVDLYAHHTEQLLSTSPEWSRTSLPGVCAPRPTTAYERRGVEAGRTITDLVYRFADTSPPGDDTDGAIRGTKQPVTN